MKKITTFRDLIVWQRSHQLVLKIYRVSKSFPSEERYGLTSQIRRAATSIPTNIVEGHKRRSRRDYLHFLNIAESSLEEVKYLLLLSADLEMLSRTDFEDLESQSNIIGRMLYRLQNKLAQKGSTCPNHGRNKTLTENRAL